MILEVLQNDEHVYSGLVRSRLLNAQRCMGDRSWFNSLELTNKQLLSQIPFSKQCTDVVQYYRANTDEQSELEFWLKHTTAASWGFTLDHKHPIQISRKNANDLPSFAGHRGWRFCAECTEEERESLGYSYWHSSHHYFEAKLCGKHKVPLFTHKKLDKHDYSLPQHWIGKAEELPIQFEWQHDWQLFIYQLCDAFKNDLTLALNIKNNVFEVLGVDQSLSYHLHKKYFDELFSAMRSDLGVDLLSSMIIRFSKGQKYRINPLWAALYDGGLSKGVRSPIHWLITVFWLRKRLSTLDGVIDDEWHSTLH